MYLLGILTLLTVDYAQLYIPEVYHLLVNGLTYGTCEIEGAIVPFNMEILLNNICLPVLIILVVLLFGRFLWRICFFGTAIRVETDLRTRMFNRCRNLSLQYYQVNKVGNLMSFFTNDLETMNECFGDGPLMLFDALSMGIMAVIKMVRMDLIMTLISMIPMVLLLASATILGKYLTQKWDARQDSFSQISDYVQEHFSGIAVIKAFVKEAKELDSFRKLNKEHEFKNVDFVKLSQKFHIMVTLFVESVFTIILIIGGRMIHEGSLDVGQVIEYIGYFNSVIWPVMAVSELIDMTSRGKASLNRISDLLVTETDVKDAPGVVDPGEIKGNIEFRNLDFSYPGYERLALQNVSFKINAGENVGIIGKTGAGKTTLADLILRCYNVPDGTLFLDGHDVNTIPISRVRENSAYVPQDNFLFSVTIDQNINFSVEPGAENKGRTEHAARVSDVHDDIMGFPEQYQTVLGERGVTLSGGQKQRVSIARAIIKDANILILDDSVSAVDVDTEKRILSELREERKNKSTIVIAHRVSTVEQMDKVLYMENNTVVAVGTHDELYNNCPSYHNMVELQRLDDATGQGEHHHYHA